MKSKKGFVFAIVPLLYLLAVVMILILLVWFGFRISDGITAIAGFFTKWWWAIALTIFGVLYGKQVIDILMRILKRFGI
jgi:hypothetical protein